MKGAAAAPIGDSKTHDAHESEGYGWSHIKLMFTTSPRELYIIYVLKLLESFNYFTFTLLYPFYLTDEFGVDDEKTGFSLGVLGSVALVYGVMFSPLIDYVGAKPCLVLSFLLSAGTRLALAFAPNEEVFFGLAYGPMSVAFALGMPVLMIAIKKYTPRRNWGMAYSLYYSMMNVAALISGGFLDLFTIQWSSGLGTGRSVLGFSNGARTLMALASVTSTLAALVALCLREPKEVRAMQLDMYGSSDLDDSTDNSASTTMLSCKDRFQELGHHWWAIMRNCEFWKFMAVCVITINMRQLFRHLDFTMPKYVKRAFGCNTPAGTLYGINPLVVIITVPFIGVLTNHITHFDMIHFGSYIHASSAFWLAGFQQLWAVALFVFQLSIGEAIWSPRWYDYSMSVAPNGREGLFVALAAAPLFFSKLPTGVLSGYLLQHYCPPSAKACPNTARSRRESKIPPPPLGTPAAPPLPDKPCNGRTMWLIIGLIAISSPLMLLVFYRWLRPKPQGSGNSSSKGRSDETWVAEVPVIAVAQLVDRDADGLILAGPVSPRSHMRAQDEEAALISGRAPLLPRSQAKSD